MKTIRSPKVAEAPPQTWSNMKVANGYFHIRRLSLLNLDRGKARWFAQGQPTAQGGDQRDRRNRRGWLVRRSRAASELSRENPDLAVWVVPAIINCGSDPA